MATLKSCYRGCSMPTNNPDPLLWLEDSRGNYIPQAFAQSFADRDKDVSGVDAEQWAILEAGPEHEHYWSTWDDVMDSARIKIDEVEYCVWQDGDVWLIPDGMEYNEDKQTWPWVWPEDELGDEDEEPDATEDEDE
jgi:hypothetical protein